MKKCVLSLGIVLTVLFIGGCGSSKPRTPDYQDPRVVTQPETEPPILPTPVETKKNDDPILRPDNNSGDIISSDQESNLVYQAKLDLLRLLICCDGESGADDLKDEIKRHFVNLNYRVLDFYKCPGYNPRPETVERLADEYDADLMVLARLTRVDQKDKFGNYYLYEAEADGKVLQIVGNEVLASKDVYVYGKRTTNQSQAVKNTVQKCGEELAGELSYEILRKSGSGVLVRRIQVDGLKRVKYVDYIETELQKLPGVKSVSRISWDSQTGRALFWVRMDAGIKDNLAAYLEQLDTIHLKVTRLDKTGLETDKTAIPQ